VLVASEDIKNETGITPTVVDVHRLKPLPTKPLLELIAEAEKVYMVEENYCYLAKELAFAIQTNGLSVKLSSLSVPEKYYSQGADRGFMRNLGGVSADQISSWLKKNWGS
jgi:deoxyxylulose-5-phosphate synthase